MSLLKVHNDKKMGVIYFFLLSFWIYTFQGESSTVKSFPSASTSNAMVMQDASTITSTSVGTSVEPDCFGPCEPGTSVHLDGIVWHETDTGENGIRH